eukprot:m.476096 g.476096  ORF g.476096 m.476096 type:complete len:328 (+) comp40063_c0_seq1:45-1028(+)
MITRSHARSPRWTCGLVTLVAFVAIVPVSTEAGCNLTAIWKWDRQASIDIDIRMTGLDTFNVTLSPSIDWKTAAGTIKPVWSGVAAVNMTSEAGMKMDGYIYENCSIIAAGVNSGIWFRKGATPPAPPAPPTFAPSQPPSPSSPDVVWDTPSEDVTGSMPLGNGRLGINVWVDDTSTIGIMMSHVDALDENAILSKLGRVLIRVVPSPPRPASSEQRNYTIRPGMIGPQPPIGTMKCNNQSGCPHVAAAACDAFPSCDGFGLNPTWNSGQVAELYSGSLTSATPSYFGKTRIPPGLHHLRRGTHSPFEWSTGSAICRCESNSRLLRM